MEKDPGESNASCEKAEIMGMFSAAQQRAPNSTMSYLSARLRATKNKTVDFLDKLEEAERESYVSRAINVARKARIKHRTKQKESMEEMARRQIEKKEKKAMQERRKVERKIRNSSVTELKDEFGLSVALVSDLQMILDGGAAGRDVVHVWTETHEQTRYHGRIEKLKKSKTVYVVGYWGAGETYDDAIDYDISMYELAADLVCDDLTIF